MKKEGIVSIWAGRFEEPKSLMVYAAEDYFDEEDNEVVSPFNKDFLGGEIWPFDPDFWERGMVDSTSDPKKLVCEFSYGDSIGEALTLHFPKGLRENYNAVILVYDYQYNGDAGMPNAPVKFLAAVPYEKYDS